MGSEFTTFEFSKGNRNRVECPDYVGASHLLFSRNSFEVLRKRYLRKGADGTPLETVAGMFYRVANVVAEPEGEWGDVGDTTRLAYPTDDDTSQPAQGDPSPTTL